MLQTSLSLAVRAFALCMLSAAAGCAVRACAQSVPAAVRGITPSVFVGAAGVDTGLASGRNVSVAGGIDMTFRVHSQFRPSLEYRAMYALDRGDVDSIKNNMGGLKVSRRFGRFQPYADILAGRAETTYANGGYPVPNSLTFYLRSAATVYSIGGGADIFAVRHFALKVDIQAQHYSSPVTTSGSLYSGTGILGLVYVFHFGDKGR